MESIETGGIRMEIHGAREDRQTFKGTANKNLTPLRIFLYIAAFIVLVFPYISIPILFALQAKTEKKTVICLLMFTGRLFS
jgi:hypothetical protein